MLDLRTLQLPISIKVKTPLKQCCELPVSGKFLPENFHHQKYVSS
jgi:hypothetical protein